MHGLKAPASALYMGNSGTSMRLLSGMLSAQKFDSVMTGDASLSKRPMERIAKPLRLMGAQIQTTGEKGTPPVSITGGQQLKGIQYDLPMASAQVKSGILLAGLWAEGETSVTEPNQHVIIQSVCFVHLAMMLKLKAIKFPLWAAVS